MPNETQQLPGVSESRFYQNLWKDPDSFATWLFLSAADRLSDDWLSWDPVALVDEIRDEFDVTPNPLCTDKLFAAVTIVTTDQFYEDLPTFIQCCNVLCGTPFDPMVFDPADAIECAWGISEAVLLNPPEDIDKPFSEDILKYIEIRLKEEGIVYPPNVLALAGQPAFNFPLADDPEALQLFKTVSAVRSKSIDLYVRERMKVLLAGIVNLPLKNGDARAYLNAD